MKPVAYLLIVLFALLGMASAKDNAMVFYNANWDCQSKADVSYNQSPVPEVLRVNPGYSHSISAAAISPQRPAAPPTIHSAGSPSWQT